MNTFISRITGLLLFLILLQPQLSEAQHTFDQEKLNTYLTTLEESDKFMGSVAILEDENVLFRNSYGMASQGQPSDVNTIYRIGSITKTYTSTMLM